MLHTSGIAGSTESKLCGGEEAEEEDQGDEDDDKGNVGA